MWDLYWVYYIMGIVMIPAIIITAWAQTKVSTSVERFSQVDTMCGISAKDLIRKLLDSVGMRNVEVTHISGKLTDHFDSRKKVIALSDTTYDSCSVAALGIACHEFGHALQWQKHYFPLKLRQFLIPITRFMSIMMWPLLIIGLIFNFFVFVPGNIGDTLLLVGASIFGLSVIVSLVTLPVEYNASKRAVKILEGTHTLTEDELEGAKEVLSSAALTYVAALITSILSALRLILTILVIRGRSDRR